jgi:hypothetical protein
MTPQEYLEQRLQDQIDWYDRKGSSAQRRFRTLRMLEIVLAASVPVFAGLVEPPSLMRIGTGLLGGLIVILAGMLSLNQFEEKWVQYRTTCESLKQEKYLYLTGTPPYDASDAFATLVRRVEGLLSTENRGWAEYAKAGTRASAPADGPQSSGPA